MKALRLVLFVILSLFLVTSCHEMTNAQKASKIAKKRWKHIKHDCNCHSYVYPIEEEKEI